MRSSHAERKDKSSQPPQAPPDVAIGLGTRLGVWVDIRPGARIGRNCAIASNVVIGPHVCVADGVVIGQAAIVGVGEEGETRIDHGVVIGQGAIIRSGVAIGQGAIVPPGAVISENVPARTVAGNLKASRPGILELARTTAWWERAAFAFLLAFCAAFYAVYQAPLLFDANNYYLAGVSVFLNGILARHELSDLRTYGYPLIIALGHHASQWTLLSPRTLVVIWQVLLYAGAVFGLRLALARFKDDSLPARLIVAGLALNVFVLIYLREILTEAPSLGLIVLLFTLLYISAKTASRRAYFWCLAGGSMACGFLVMIRPGNLFLFPVWIVGQLLAGDLRRRNGLARPFGLIVASAVMAAGIALPMVVQVRNNDVHFGRPTPLPVFDLGTGQQELGIRWLKMATLIPPSPAPQIRYYNPFSGNDPGVHQPLRWYLTNPLRGAATLAIHLFSLLDMDVPLPYTSTPLVWYRWPWGILNHLAVGLAVAGVWFVWLGARRAALRFDRLPGYALATFAIYVAGYCAIYVPVCTEVRFGFPLMLAVMPLAFLAAAGMRQSGPRAVKAIAGGVVIYTIGALALSEWVRAQAPLIQDFRTGQVISQPASGTDGAGPQMTPVFGQSGRGRIELPSAKSLEKPDRATTEFGLVTSVLSEVPSLTGRVGGRPLQGQPFLFAHASSYLSYALEAGKWTVFSFSMGLDDIGGHDQGTVVYIVRGDGKDLYRSPIVRAMTPPTFVSVPIAGVRKLELIVTNGGDTIASDEAYWIDPRLN